MKAADCMIAWTPAEDAPTFRPHAIQARCVDPAAPGTVTVVAWPDDSRRSDPHQSTVGACNSEWCAADDLTRTALVFVAFHTLTVRDRVPVGVAHRALLEIDEYRDTIAPDIEGADDDGT